MFHGGPNGLSTVASTTFGGSGDWGGFLASPGDLNGDGYGDVLVAEPNQFTGSNPRAYVYLGSALGLQRGAVGSLRGQIVVGVGDLDGDGLDDWGAGERSDVEHSVLFVRGQRGFAPLMSSDRSAWPFRFRTRFVQALAPWSDINGDGVRDLVAGVGGYHADNDTGMISVHLGRRGQWFTGNSDRIIVGDQAGGLFGRFIASGFDLDLDGYDDVAVMQTNGVQILRGGPGGPATSAVPLGPSDCAGAVVCGDLNGDGRVDLLAGCRTRFSIFLATPGPFPRSPDVMFGTSGNVAQADGWSSD